MIPDISFSIILPSILISNILRFYLVDNFEMGERAMDYQQFLDEIEKIINDLVRVEERVIGTKYRDLFFSKFKIAYDSGLFKDTFPRDRILYELICKWCAENRSTLNRKKGLLEELIDMANAWADALQRYHA
jgi:hypothetical protein